MKLKRYGRAYVRVPMTRLDRAVAWLLGFER